MGARGVGTLDVPPVTGIADLIDVHASAPCSCPAHLVGVIGTCSTCGGVLPEPDAIDRAILAHEAARNVRLARESLGRAS